MCGKITAAMVDWETESQKKNQMKLVYFGEFDIGFASSMAPIPIGCLEFIWK